MSDTGKLDLELHINLVDTGYQSELKTADGSAILNSFRLSYAPHEIENLITYLRQAQQYGNGLDSPEMQVIQQFGWSLFNQVFNNQMEGALRERLVQARREDHKIRLRLALDPEDSLLNQLPWEYLYYPNAKSYFNLAGGIIFSRSTGNGLHYEYAKISLPLKMLVFDDSSDSSNYYLEIEEAVKEQRYQGLLQITAAPNAADIANILADDEFHLIWLKCSFAAETSASSHSFSISESSHWLSICPKLRILILEKNTNELAEMNALGNSLVHEGWGGCVLIPFELNSEGREIVARGLLSGLAQGLGLDEAVARIRELLFTSGHEADWGALLVFTAHPTGKMFQLESQNSEEIRKRQLSTLSRDAKVSLDQEKWARAKELLEQLLQLEPDRPELKKLLDYARRNQTLDEQYQNAKTLLQEERWLAALEEFHKIKAQDSRNRFKDLPSLIVEAESKVQDIQKIEEATSLFSSAQMAVMVKDWTLAIERLEQALRLYPALEEAESLFKQVRLQQQLLELYTVGRDCFEAERWHEALERLYKLRELDSGMLYGDTHNMIAEAEAKESLEQKKSQIIELEAESQYYFEQQRWNEGISCFEQLLKLAPAHPTASEKIAFARVQLILADLFAKGDTALAKEQWLEAIEFFTQLHSLDGLNQYPQASLLVAETELKIDKAQKRARTATMLEEANTALAKEIWATAIRKLEVALTLEPDNAEASEKLEYARNQQTLSTLYQKGRENYEAKRWDDALEIFGKLQAVDKSAQYSDVEALISITSEKRTESQLEAMYAGVKIALEQQDWAAAHQKLESIFAINPSFKDTAELLNKVRQKVAESLSQNAAAFLNEPVKSDSGEYGYQIELKLTTSLAGYQLEMTTSEGNRYLGNFALTYNSQQLDNLLWYLRQARYIDVGFDSPEMRAVQKFGWNLFIELFNNEMETALRNILVQGEREGKFTTIRLLLGSDSTLNILPWEYLYYPYANSYLGLAGDISLVRLVETEKEPVPVQVRGTVRVLCWVSAPEGYTKIDSEEYRQALADSAGEYRQRGLISLERVKDSTFSALQKQLWVGEHHVLWVVAPVERGELRITGEDGEPESLSVLKLWNLLKEHPGIRLVVFETSVGDGATGINTIAQALVEQGLAGCVALPFEISEKTRETLAHEILGGISEGKSINSVMAQARFAIYENKNQVEWGTPILYTQRRDGILFNILSTSPDEQRVKQLEALENEADSAIEREEWGRSIERLQKLLELDPYRKETAQKLHQLEFKQVQARLYAEGRGFFDSGNWSEALRVFRTLKENDSDGHYLIVDWLITDSQHNLEEQLYQEHLSQLYTDALAAFETEEWDAAVNGFEIIVNKEPEYREVAQLVAQARQKLKEAQERVPRLYEEARQALKEKNWVSAIEKLVDVLAAEPDHPNAQQLLDKVRYYQILEALKFTLKMQIESKKWYEAAITLELLRKRDKKGEFTDIISSAKVVITEVNNKINTLMGISRVAIEEQEWDKAIEKLTAVLELSPEQPEANVSLPRVQLSQSLQSVYQIAREKHATAEWQEALDGFRQVKMMDRGGLYTDLDWYITDTQARMEESNHQAQFVAMEQEAQFAVDRGDWAVAVQKLENLLAIYPYHPETQNKLTYVKQQLELEQLYIIGNDHLQAGRWQEASETLRRLQAFDMYGRYPQVAGMIAFAESNYAPIQPLTSSFPLVSSTPSAQAHAKKAQSSQKNVNNSQTTGKNKNKETKSAAKTEAAKKPLVPDSTVSFRVRLLFFFWGLIPIALLVLLVLNLLRR
ncbi:CHAT domain-containing protein [Candidatus Chlorohelix sp.]|uniref:CHAT domain-containing protein n=1 Tax=Candidatus Chlorohelix sp. TaxID=3139201 RepID=UPI00304B0BEA